MGIFSSRAASAVLTAIFFFSANAKAVDIDTINKQLIGEGVSGWVHGAVSRSDQYVFTYRTPGNFFDHAEFPLISKSNSVLAELAKLQRHDRIVIKGKFLDSNAPIQHILVDELKVTKKFETSIEAKPFEYKTELPKDLEGKTEFIANVHAIGQDGRMLVVEYKDTIIPIPVSKPEFSRALFRNDKVKIQFTLKKNPPHPKHVLLDPKAARPITVLARINDLHEKPGMVEGNLILFPKSPEIIFNVFAVQQLDPDGFTRQFTLVNFNPETFKAIREKLQKLWDDKPAGVVNARNKFLNTEVKIRAVGKFSDADPGQANPQILLDSSDSIQLIN